MNLFSIFFTLIQLAIVSIVFRVRRGKFIAFNFGEPPVAAKSSQAQKYTRSGCREFFFALTESCKQPLLAVYIYNWWNIIKLTEATSHDSWKLKTFTKGLPFAWFFYRYVHKVVARKNKQWTEQWKRNRIIIYFIRNLNNKVLSLWNPREKILNEFVAMILIGPFDGLK